MALYLRETLWPLIEAAVDEEVVEEVVGVEEVVVVVVLMK